MSSYPTVSDLLRSLSYGEFSNLSLGMEGAGSILESAHPRIIKHMNDGLLQLYSQFILDEKDLLVQMVEGITYYHLDPRFGEAAWDMAVAPYPYIKDGLAPFRDDLIKVLAVYDSCGNQVPLNDNEDPASVFTPRANLLQIPRVQNGVCLSLLYQAKHPPLSHERLDDLVFLPHVLHGALTAYVAWQVYSSMNTTESTVKAMEHKARFEKIGLGAVADDLVSTSISTTNSRFAKRGWV